MAKPSSLNTGRLLVVLAALLWSSSGAFVKSPPLEALSRDAAGPTIAFYRAVVATLVLLPFFRPSRLKWHPALPILVLSFAAMNILFISSMTLTTAANTILLQYSAPIWMFIASVTLLREKVDRRSLAGLVLGMLGVAVILRAFVGGAETLGVCLGIGAGLGYAAVVVCLRVLRDHDPIVLTTLNFAVSAAVLIPWVVISGATPTASQAGVITAFGIIQVAAAYLVFARGMQTVSPQEAGVITLLEPVLNPLWVLLLWHEPVAGATIVGGVFILAGLGVRYLPIWKGSARSQSEI